MMTTTTTQPRDNTSQIAGQPNAANGLALVRMTIGAMFVWVFFENLGKGGYTPSGYAGVINSYIKSSHAPVAWKWVMGLMASHAAMAAWLAINPITHFHATGIDGKPCGHGGSHAGRDGD